MSHGAKFYNFLFNLLSSKNGIGYIYIYPDISSSQGKICYDKIEILSFELSVVMDYPLHISWVIEFSISRISNNEMGWKNFIRGGEYLCIAIKTLNFFHLPIKNEILSQIRNAILAT